MKVFVRNLLVLLILATASVQAATCRSGSAAAQGSQTGYNRDKQAAEQTATSERSSSDILGKCVSGVTSIITAPQFPSLSSIFDQVKNKVCQIASDQINSTVNDVNSEISGVMSNINSQVSSTTGLTSQVSTGSVQASTTSTDNSQFWSNIWK